MCKNWLIRHMQPTSFPGSLSRSLLPSLPPLGGQERTLGTRLVCNLQPTNQLDREVLVIHLYHLDLKFKRHKRCVNCQVSIYSSFQVCSVRSRSSRPCVFFPRLSSISIKSIAISFFKSPFRREAREVLMLSIQTLEEENCHLYGDRVWIPPGAHQMEPPSPIQALGVNPFPSRFIIRTVPRGDFARRRWKEPITTS